MSEREEVSICCARMCACWNAHYMDTADEVAALRQRVQTAERERDEARREWEREKMERAAMEMMADDAVSERDRFASMLHDCENERDGWKHRAERAEQAAVNVITSFISGRDCSDSPCGYGKAAGISPEFCMCRKEAREELAEAVRALDASGGSDG